MSRNVCVLPINRLEKWGFIPHFRLFANSTFRGVVMKVFRNKNNSLNGFFIFLAAAVFSIFTFAACEVGLGSAVDTQPPTVAIAYPPSLSIIRESFVFE